MMYAHTLPPIDFDSDWWAVPCGGGVTFVCPDCAEHAEYDDDGTAVTGNEALLFADAWTVEPCTILNDACECCGRIPLADGPVIP